MGIRKGVFSDFGRRLIQRICGVVWAFRWRYKGFSEEAL